MKDIVSKFRTEGTVTGIKPLGNGLINDTYIVTTAGGDTPDYVLQRINHNIFKDVEGLQNNIVSVTKWIRKKLESEDCTDINRRVLRFIPVKDSDRTYYHDDSNDSYWRMMVYIPETVTLSDVTPESAEDAGRSFGNFQKMLVDIEDKLVETIPDFHNMELRLRQFEEAVANDAAGRVEANRELIGELLSYGEEMTKAERLYREGKLPKRICHCDTKVNNMLFDHDGKVLCVIDLDTVMPSFVFSDFGDFLRTGACTAAEDEEDLSKIKFDMNIFEAFARGYLSEASQFLTPVEIENLPFAARLFPYMQAVRFMTDYLNGDTYYKIKYKEHNFVRTLAQKRMFDCATECEEQMKKVIEYYGKN